MPDPIDLSPILSSRFSHITHEVYRTHDITEEAKKRSEGKIKELKIERIYATDFAVELVSSSVDVFSDWSDVSYKNLCQDLFDLLFGVHEPDLLKVGPILSSKVHSDLVAVARIILCDDLPETWRKLLS